MPQHAVSAGMAGSAGVPLPALIVGVAVVVVIVAVMAVVAVVPGVVLVRPDSLAARRSVQRVLVTAVLFDFYGTLARAVTWGPRIEDLLNRRGLALDPDAHARWQEEVADGIEHLAASASREHYLAWERQRLCRLVESCGGSAADVDEVAAEIYTAMKSYTLEAYEEVPDVLRQLRDRGVMVAVCSNWDWDLDRALAQVGLDTLVDVAVTSAQAGARKPHPRIYRYTLERCRVAAPDALFVGDTWGADVEGPLSAGLRPVHVWRAGEPHLEADPPPLIDGVHRLPDLSGLADVLSPG